jgi:hypothetical protein
MLLVTAEPVIESLLVHCVLVSRILKLVSVPDIFTLLTPSVKYDSPVLLSVSLPRT